MPEEKPHLSLKTAEKRDSRICRKSDHDVRKSAREKAEEHTLSLASRIGHEEAEMQAKEGPAGPRCAAGRCEEAAGRTRMEGA